MKTALILGEIFQMNHSRLLTMVGGIGVWLATAAQVLGEPPAPAVAEPVSPIVTLASGEWPPFTGHQLPHRGFCVHVVAAAFAAMNHQVVIQHFPWRRAYKYVEEGSFDATPCWARNDELAAAFHLSMPLMTQSVVFFHRRHRPFAWDTVADLVGVPVGIVQGYSYVSLTTASERLHLEAASDEETNFRKLLRGRIELYPVEIAVGYHLLQQKFSEDERGQITHHPKPLELRDYFLLISRRLPSERGQVLQTRFNEGMARIRASGRYQQLENDLLAGKYTVAQPAVAP